MKSLRLKGVHLRTGTRLVEILDDEVIVETPSGRERIRADTVVMAVGARPVNDLLSVHGIEGIRIITIGDAKEPRKIVDAVREGFEEALRLDDATLHR